MAAHRRIAPRQPTAALLGVLVLFLLVAFLASPGGQALAQADDAPAPHLAIGKRAPRLETKDVSGEKLRLSAYRGQGLVVVFAAPKDAVSRRYLRRLVALAGEFAPALKVVVLSSALEGTDVQQAVAARALYQQTLRRAGHVRVVVATESTRRSFGALVHKRPKPLRDLPSTFFIDATGIIRGVAIGERTRAAFVNDVRQYLGLTLPGAAPGE